LYDKNNAGTGIGPVLIKNAGETSFSSRRDWDKCEIDINNDGKNYDIITKLLSAFMVILTQNSLLLQEDSCNFYRHFSPLDAACYLAGYS